MQNDMYTHVGGTTVEPGQEDFSAPTTIGHSITPIGGGMSIQM